MTIRFILCLLFLIVPISSFEMPTNIEHTIKNQSLECMARNIFYEAGSESMKGKLAVAYVTHNRSLNDKFPDDICSVVYQKNQFSWTQNKLYQKRHTPTDQDWRWIESLYVAQNYLQHKDPTKGSLFFHEKTISPNWKMNIVQTAEIGNHMFYKFVKN